MLTLLFAVLALPTALVAQPPPWMLGPFTKVHGVNPIIAPDTASVFRSPTDGASVHWESFATFNPAAVARGGKVVLLYRAEDASGKAIIGGHTSRLGMAESEDGLHFTRRPAPVLFPDRDAQRANEWPGGVEDPRLVETDDGRYVLTYTQWNRRVPRLAVATSTDLVHWTKHGPALAAGGARYLKVESKSGAIVSRVEGERVVATRVNGKYWMYYNVPDIHIATSDDLVHWMPLEDGEGNPVRVLSPRPGYFDSWLVEPGPPALLTAHGIVLLYNAGNSGKTGDPTIPDRGYTAGQALFDPARPYRLMARADTPFIRPTEPWERTGQYSAGTTFVEALVPHGGRWFLYYGTADSRVGVAVWDPPASRAPEAVGACSLDGTTPEVIPVAEASGSEWHGWFDLPDRPRLWEPAGPDAVLMAFQAAVEQRIGAAGDPLGLIERQRAIFAAMPGAARGEAANATQVLEGRAGRIGAINCIEAMLWKWQAARHPMLTHPTEFGAFVLRARGRVRVYLSSADLVGQKIRDPVTDLVRRDLAAGYRLVGHLHNHPFLFDRTVGDRAWTVEGTKADIAGALAPSMTDVGFMRSLRETHALEQAWITNGIHSARFGEAEFGVLTAVSR